MERIKCQCKCNCIRDITFDTDYYAPENGICCVCRWGINDGFIEIHGIRINKYTDVELEEKWEEIKQESYFRFLDSLYLESITEDRVLDFPRYMTGKTILYSFNIYYKEIIIGFTDGTWACFDSRNDHESGEATLFPSFILDNLPNYLVDFHWDIVAEFEKAGVLKDTEVLREILRRKAIQNIDTEIDLYSRRFGYLKQEKERLEKGELYEKEES